MSSVTFQAEQRFSLPLLGFVLLVLFAFAAGSVLVFIAAWQDDSPWVIAGAGFVAGLCAVALVGFVGRYLIRGVRGHYVRVQAGRLETGEIEGRVLHAIPIETLERVEYDHGNHQALRIVTQAGAVRFDRLELEEPEFDALETVLREGNADVTVYRY